MIHVATASIPILIFVMGWLIKAIVSLNKTLVQLDKKQAVFGEMFNTISQGQVTHTRHIGELFLRTEKLDKELTILKYIHGDKNPEN